MLKAIIIDDEPKAIEILIWELQNFCPSVIVEATFTNALEAKKYVQLNEPDCIFLDIEMPIMDGFKFLKGFPNRSFSVVFTTAYNQYAISAIKESAVDYLLKPIESDELIACVNKLNSLKKTIPSNPNHSISKKVSFNCDGKLIFIDVENILYCKSDSNYCELFTVDKEKILLVQTLKSVEKKLNNHAFLRIHNSYLINMNLIKEYHKQDDLVLLIDGTTVPVARSRKLELLKNL